MLPSQNHVGLNEERGARRVLVVQGALVGLGLWAGGSERLGDHTHLRRVPGLLKAE